MHTSLSICVLHIVHLHSLYGMLAENSTILSAIFGLKALITKMKLKYNLTIISLCTLCTNYILNKCQKVVEHISENLDALFMCACF